ncbi:MAG: hypothetical protein ACR2PG_26400, partial [Hyphomicrobiaceae bacterium]
TPFVALRRERFLFSRLPLLLKAMFVASLMLLFMYAFYVVGEISDGSISFENNREITRLAVSTLLTTVPFLVFLLIAWIVDRRQLFGYRRRTRKRAAQNFAERWIPLTHEDDEAVRGLGSLRSIDIRIFHRDFAVPAISLLSVFLLPLAYFYVITSPKLMVAIADFLKRDVYQTQNYEQNRSGVEQMTKGLRKLNREIRGKNRRLETLQQAPARQSQMQAEIKDLRQQRADARQKMAEKYPDYRQVRRAMRFERRFLKDGDVFCTGGQLCGNGKDVLLNAKLLFHLVTDEVASWVIDRELGGRRLQQVLRAAIPVLLVPIVFGIFAVFMVLVVQALGRLISQGLSRWLDKQTWHEVRRNALGNDTEAEVVLGAVPAPDWIDRNVHYLPTEVSGKIAEHSNKAMSASISKIRDSISEFTLSEGRDGAVVSLYKYLTWQELIHLSYFEVLEFQKLVARAISDAEGFEPSTIFKSDANYTLTEEWLHTVHPDAAAKVAASAESTVFVQNKINVPAEEDLDVRRTVDAATVTETPLYKVDGSASDAEHEVRREPARRRAVTEEVS